LELEIVNERVIVRNELIEQFNISIHLTKSLRAKKRLLKLLDLK
jgi:hypothetical protein